MKLFKSEMKKSIRETLAYYPDFIVGTITNMILFFLIISGQENKTLVFASYMFWIIASGVLSEASLAISTEKQLGTLQNLFIKPHSMISIIIVKTITWFVINLVKTIIFLVILGVFYPVYQLFNLEILLILVISCIGILGLALILSALTLVFTKVASFETVISYMLLILSGSIIEMPKYVIYTNPVSCGTDLVSKVLNNNFEVTSLIVLIGISAIYLILGVLLFNFTFKRSKQFRWTY